MRLVSAMQQRILLPLLALVWTGVTHAALFNLTYDDSPNGVINAADVVGSGTFSYDGPAAAGSFLLSNLTGVNFSASFGATTFSGPPFDPANLALIGISVTDVGSGVFELVFTGQSAATNGSLDVLSNGVRLSHQPAALGGSDVGPNLYFVSTPNYFGDYLARTATVPEPATLALLGLGLAGLAASRRRKQ